MAHCRAIVVDGFRCLTGGIEFRPGDFPSTVCPGHAPVISAIISHRMFDGSDGRQTRPDSITHLMRSDARVKRIRQIADHHHA